MDTLKNTLEQLRSIEKASKELGNDIRKEGDIYAAELEDRLKKGLTGDAAIEHYNKWMEAANMSHLKVEKEHGKSN